MKTETETVAKPTPGPWVLENHGVNEPEYGHGIVHSHGGAHRFVIIKGVGTLETVDMDIQKLEANARLIAAAPELISACEYLLESFNRVQEEGACEQFDYAVHPNRDIFSSIEMLQSAISKAKGAL